jgi:hypothetical protein
MAENPLLSALNLQFSPSDTNWNLAQSILAQTAPKLISDYRSTGANLGIGLGSVLMSALLGYQARSEANQKSLLALELANEMQSKATTPETRVEFLKGLEGRDIDTDVVGKLSTLAGALSTQDRMTAMEDIKRQKTAEMEAYAKIAAEQGIPVADVANWATRRREALAGVRAGTTTGLPGDLQTADEMKAAAERQAKQTDLIKQSRAKLQEDQVYKSVQEVRALLDSAKQLSKKDTAASDDALIKIVERIGNPGNQVTLPEFERGNVNTIFQNIVGSSRRMLTGKGKLSAPARQQLIDVAETFSGQLKDVYNTRLRSEISFLKQQGVSDPLPSMVGPARYFYTNKEESDVTSRLASLSGIEASPTASEQDKIQAKTVKQQILDILKDKRNYYEQ